MVLGNIHLDALSEAHLELIDTVIDNLLQQYIYTVIALRAVAELTDVHTGTQAYVFHIAQMTYRVIGIRRCLGHVGIELQIIFFGHLYNTFSILLFVL